MLARTCMGESPLSVENRPCRAILRLFQRLRVIRDGLCPSTPPQPDVAPLDSQLRHSRRQFNGLSQGRLGLLAAACIPLMASQLQVAAGQNQDGLLRLVRVFLQKSTQLGEATGKRIRPADMRQGTYANQQVLRLQREGRVERGLGFVCAANDSTARPRRTSGLASSGGSEPWISAYASL